MAQQNETAQTIKAIPVQDVISLKQGYINKSVEKTKKTVHKALAKTTFNYGEKSKEVSVSDIMGAELLAQIGAELLNSNNDSATGRDIFAKISTEKRKYAREALMPTKSIGKFSIDLKTYKII